MADLSGRDEVIVFLVGFRPNTLWKVWTWWRVVYAMRTMLRHLDTHPETGAIGMFTSFFPMPMMIQYWNSFDDLERFARDPGSPHLEPWRSYNRMTRVSADVGLWHETYRVRSSDLETIYANMAAIGLGKAVGSMPVRRRHDTAAARLGLRADPDAASSPS